MLRKFGFFLLGVAVVLAVVLIIAIMPFFGGPSESHEALQSRYTEYRAAADELQNRPKSDLEALFGLVQELEPVLAKETEPDTAMMGLLYATDRSCPSYDIEKVRASEPDIRVVTAMDNRLHAIVDDGFVVQQDVSLTSEVPDFTSLRRFVYAQLAASVLDGRSGTSGPAAERVVATERVADGLLATPFIIDVMIGIALANRIDEVAVSLAPALSREDLLRVRDAVAGRPNVVATLMDAMMVETVAVADSLYDPDNAKAAFATMIPRLAWIWPIAKYADVIGRARWSYLATSGHIIDYYRAWYNSGALEPPPELSAEIHKELRSNPLAAVAIPNYHPLLDKAYEADVHEKSVIKALDAWSVEGFAGASVQKAWDYDDTHKILMYSDYGCIVKSTTSGAREARPDTPAGS